MVYTQITQLIGNTPLLRLDESVHGIPNLELYAKLEYMNPFGSVKDRAVLGMLEDELEQIQKKDQTIIEMSSGNTAKAIQAIAGIHGIPFKTITNRIKVDEVRDILRLQGAQIEELPGESDCHDPHDPHDPLVYIHKEIAAYPDKRFFTSQYNNEKNIDAHYRTTGEEIVSDLDRVDYYFAGLGTTGSSRGPASRIKERDTHLQVFGVVAAASDYIPGIRTKDEMFQVGLMQPDFYEDVFACTSVDAISGMVTLVRKAGVFSGPTGGAVFHTLCQYFKTHPPTSPVRAVFIVCDRVEWYMSYIKKRAPELFSLSSRMYDWKADVQVQNNTEDVSMTAEAVLDLQRTQSAETLIVDIRSSFAFKTTHIANSINLPFEQLDDMFSKQTNPFCVHHTIICVCPVGEKSTRVAQFLRSKGVRAYSLAGGITQWRDKAFSLERDTHV